jgi:DNA-binding transcriptional regulator YiaG
MYHYTECGLPNIWLANGYRAIETKYGPATQIEHVEALHRAIALAIVRHRPHLTGSEFRFLRTELDLSQARLATYFGYDAQSVAIWEKKGKVPKWADRFLRALYQEATEGNAHIREIIDRLNDMDQQEFARQEFEERDGAWRLHAA